MDAGFDPDAVLTVRLDLPSEEYRDQQRRLFFPEVLQRIAGLPGVQAAGATNTAPSDTFALGWAGAFALTRFLASLLYDTTPTDAATFAAVALLLAGVATAAGYLPARRAAAIDPRLAFTAD